MAFAATLAGQPHQVLTVVTSKYPLLAELSKYRSLKNSPIERVK